MQVSPSTAADKLATETVAEEEEEEEETSRGTETVSPKEEEEDKFPRNSIQGLIVSIVI